MTFEVFLSTALSGDDEDVTVDYNLVPVITNTGSTPPVYAADLDDLTEVSGTLTFSVDGVAVVHRVDVATFDDGDGDGTDEHDETFSFVLSNPSAGLTLSATAATGTGTIYDNDLPPTLVVSDAEAYEGSSVNFTVTLSARSEKTVSVEAAVRSISVNAAGTPATGEDADRRRYRYSTDSGRRAHGGGPTSGW